MNKEKNNLGKFAALTDPLLKNFFNEQKAAVPRSLAYARRMIDVVEDFCMRGGKRLRPALVYYGYKLVGGKKEKDILKASLAMELVHAFLLIHDDIMDEDEMRRGKATVHKLYENEYKTRRQKHTNPKHSKHFGETMAILAGDLASQLATTLILSTTFDAEMKIRAISKLSETVKNTIFGQELDIRLETSPAPTPAEILNVYRLKTAQYTFESPLHIGLILAKATPKNIQDISRYAVPGGIAFQIQDDILGIFGNEKKLGKPILSDIKQGKQTLLVAKALEMGNSSHRKQILSALGRKQISKRQAEEVRLALKNSGALAYCKDLAKKYAEQAKDSLKQFNRKKYNQEVIETLSGLADLIIKREA
ncbi:MAG: hypothetical protein A3C80_01345 [Candidatus Ryanbacteria bacterium RIFCSPHIGHO2_02_FULL_45_43]|uniref:Polyprenyl synthetase n=1 Tax=Candidatus Ryanbacteria bacterium RIFCSPHIGHO2_01_45_13 TaxID=1802112 RepID=A0A1G2G2R7_9BACT|nr:MAG: hypothetical protein A2718_04200 [Candidatus Ryanbacteria bacterium RIFCSPHIGHO2_01_FULL_44_130]OGZ44108.1 MAG: hypothetical protein A2W41_00080 [Candidatus Ryanbacteria bacterium RIFCSPHIGHO2_01_45_13]OGZ48905.1 MAG: hypothetical protein A3C80_01345 [Candidatus Ryanbacteria bacterium RIFCSPHIGHO2_02_FULL_45_43]OGZ50950.1 MAG: hypothetical protein A3E55_02880 [Candidatus Ryanbacteria bacterium RIFCSPHIGHO2_12_FULL_44_20]OGZ51788.1 MAG: hypothetical protein A3A17_02235 [Candidatus Ryanba